MKIQPGMTPPPGVGSNFENPDRRVNTINIITQSLCISFTSTFFLLRVYVRIHVHKTFGREDWTCLGAWILGLAYSITAIMMGHYGGGIHQWDVPKHDVIPFFKTVYGTMVMYGPAAFLTKVSILLILSRVFSPYRKIVIFIYLFLGAMLAYYIPAVIVKVRICLPISYFWLGSPSGTCLDERAIILADAIMSVVSDLMILCLPMVLTRSLQMSLKKKLRVIGILGAGGLACASGIIRLVWIVQSKGSLDQTYIFMRINLWGNAEVSIGIICACLPSIASLIGRLLRERRSKESRNITEYGLSLKRMPSTSLKGPTVRSHIVCPQPDSEQDILVSHAQGGRQFETAIRADRPYDDGTDSERRGNHIGCHGILRTIDVSYTVTNI